MDRFTEEEMINKARGWGEIIYRYTRETEPTDFDKFIMQLIQEYLHMKEKQQ